METKLNELKTRLLEVNDLNSANALLELGSEHLHAARRRGGARPADRPR